MKKDIDLERLHFPEVSYRRRQMMSQIRKLWNEGFRHFRTAKIWSSERKQDMNSCALPGWKYVDFWADGPKGDEKKGHYDICLFVSR